MRARSSVLVALAITMGLAASPAWAMFCRDSFSAGGRTGRLVAEVLMVEVEETDEGLKITMSTTGYYRTGDGHLIRVDCAGDPNGFVELGVSA